VRAIGVVSPHVMALSFRTKDARAYIGSNMNVALKNGFPPFPNKQSLRSAIESVCAKFGRVTYLDILPAKREPHLRCACFLRLDSLAAESRLRTELVVSNYDVGQIHFFANVDDENWTGPKAL
jgi:hypothetical protein